MYNIVEKVYYNKYTSNNYMSKWLFKLNTMTKAIIKLIVS